jgi:HlyD family secretion protein
MALDHAAIAQLRIERQPAETNATKQSNTLLQFSFALTITISAIGLALFWPEPQAAAVNAQATVNNVAQDNKLQLLIATEQNNDNYALVKPIPAQSGTKVLDASGHIVARQVANVSSRVTGKLNALYLAEGQQVAKNQIIAEVDAEQAKIAYLLAQAELSSQQAHAEELAVALRFSDKTLQRQRDLFTTRLISEQQLDNGERDQQQLQAQRHRQQAVIALAEQKLALAQYQLAQHQIRAPFTGVVISKNAQVGELISSGNSSGGSIRTGVATIVDMDSLEIEVEVSENYINRVHVGQNVIATLDAYPDWHIDSHVVAVIPTADRQKASIKVRVKLLTYDARIFPDMGVKVSFLKA